MHQLRALLRRLPRARTRARLRGPAAVALGYRYNRDSRDEGETERWESMHGGEGGVWSCSYANECSEVCPKNVDPAMAIQQTETHGRVAVDEASPQARRPMSAAAPTPTLPARAPDGYPFRFSNYRELRAVRHDEPVHGRGVHHPAGWRERAGERRGGLERVSRRSRITGHALVEQRGADLHALLRSSIRLGRSQDPAGGKIGRIPLAPAAIPMPLLGLAPIGGFVALWLVVLLVLGGAIG